jgi:hypothetical protein
MRAMDQHPRVHRRIATNAAGLAKFDGREVPVVLRDRSLEGAKLRPLGKSTLPDKFKLVIPLEKIDSICTVVWRRGSDCGVKFG